MTGISRELRYNRTDTDRNSISNPWRGIRSLQHLLYHKDIIDTNLLANANAKNETSTSPFMQVQQLEHRPEMAPDQ